MSENIVYLRTQIIDNLRFCRGDDIRLIASKSADSTSWTITALQGADRVLAATSPTYQGAFFALFVKSADAVQSQLSSPGCDNDSTIFSGSSSPHSLHPGCLSGATKYCRHDFIHAALHSIKRTVRLIIEDGHYCRDVERQVDHICVLSIKEAAVQASSNRGTPLSVWLQSITVNDYRWNLEALNGPRITQDEVDEVLRNAVTGRIGVPRIAVKLLR